MSRETDNNPKASRIEFNPIGVIHSPFTNLEEAPRQGMLRRDLVAELEIFPEYTEGLKDIESFPHLILFFYFHRSDGYDLIAKPFGEETPRGVFTLRSPRRPNPIGMTVVRLLGREGNVLRVACVDMMEGTPLLDIKPYIPHVDGPCPEREAEQSVE